MLVIKEMLYFMFAQFLMVVILCLIIGSGWVLNTLCKELLDVDIVSLIRITKEKKDEKQR